MFKTSISYKLTKKKKQKKLKKQKYRQFNQDSLMLLSFIIVGTLQSTCLPILWHFTVHWINDKLVKILSLKDSEYSRYNPKDWKGLVSEVIISW